MAKKSMSARDKKRSKTANRCQAKRVDLKEKVVNLELDFDERMDYQRKLQDMPRNASPVRVQRRCRVCGRPRAVYRRFGLCRIHLREFAMKGLIPGIVKSSW